MSERTAFVGGNWKMNLDLASAGGLAGDLVGALGEGLGAEVVVFPPFPYLPRVREVLGGAADAGKGGIGLGAQDVYFEAEGAFTGEVSVGMLADCSVTHVLSGHSERRHVIGESDKLVGKKTAAVVKAGLTCVVCIGELLEEREAGRTDAVNERQLRAALAGVSGEMMERVVVAYEPVWAIGTGRTATPNDAQMAHAAIRGVLGEMYGETIAGATRIIYGGSVKAGNAAELFAMPDIDGGLIGGASLKAEDFAAICRSC
jgi:triosephosphate isomerase (TIM)